MADHRGWGSRGWRLAFLAMMNFLTSRSVGWFWCCIVGGILAASEPPPGQASGEPPPSSAATPAAADELLLFQEMPTVISSARQEQPINLTGAPVGIVSSEDIHYGGFTNIPDALMFAPGVDVLRIDRNRYAVGVHGLHDTFSDRTLSLVDGRAADSPMFGGSEFHRLPVLMEDIERIEVVRGPGGAAWGANAFDGVINVITKDPEAVQGFFGSGTVNLFGDSYTHARWGHRAGPVSWKLSLGYEEFESSSDALQDEDFESRDFAKALRFDGRLKWKAADRTTVSLGAGHASERRGDFEFLGYYPEEDEHLETTRGFLKVDHEFEGGTTAYLQWFGNFAESDQPSLTDYFTAVNDLESQVNLAPLGAHRLSLGGNLRWIYLDNEPETDQQLRGTHPVDEYLAGLFVMDRWKPVEMFQLEGQVRGDYYSGTEGDWSGRLTGFLFLDGEERHVLRLSGARAFRAPTPAYTWGSTYRIPTGLPPPDDYAVRLLANPDLENEEVYGVEAGYSGQIIDGWTARIDGSYQRYQDLIGFVRVPFGTMFDDNFKPMNLEGADSFGVEVETGLTGKLGSISVWYGFTDFETDEDGQEVRAFLPAKHKAGVTARLRLPWEFTLNGNYKYSSKTPANGPYFEAPSFNRIDLTLAKSFLEGRIELLGGVMDLLNETEILVAGEGDISHFQETPGRTVFFRLQVSF